jgi:large subunit ribosomal protein L4
MVEGSTRKLYAQKHTGNARAGTLRTGKRVGGGVTFAKVARDFSQRMPKKQRRLARDSAILAKVLGDNLVVVDSLSFDKPRTKDFASILGSLKIDRSCLVVISNYDDNLFKSARNIRRVAVTPVAESNAWEICNHKKVLFTKEALLSVVKEDKAGEN